MCLSRERTSPPLFWDHGEDNSLATKADNRPQKSGAGMTPYQQPKQHLAYGLFSDEHCSCIFASQDWEGATAKL